MGIANTADSLRQAEDPFIPRDRQHLAHMRVVAQQRRIGLLRQHGDPGARMSGPDGAEERRGEKDVPDGAEANDEDVGTEVLGHGENVGGKAVRR
jgi:hypothetical protein